jgi:hypothetical protein
MNIDPRGELVSGCSSMARARGLTERLVDGELIIYDPRSQRVHALNPTAAVIWMACADGQDRSVAVDLLCERFGEDRASIERDVAATVEMFLTEGLLTG